MLSHFLLQPESLANFNQKLPDSIVYVNLGIEVETCIKENQLLNIYNFEKKSDHTIICPHGYEKVEFVHRKYINSMNLDTEYSFTKDINIINSIPKHTYIGTYCLNESCALHFHISNDNIVYNLYGLYFLCILFEKWVERYQTIFLSKYQYKLSRDKYSLLNIFVIA